MSFQFVPKSVTLNDLERRNGIMALIYLRHFTEFCSFRVHCVKVVDIGPRPT